MVLRSIIVVLLAVAALGQPADTKTSGLSISIDAHRPLAALADELEKRYQVVVTYEDCPWAHAAHKAAVAFTYDAPADHRSVAVSDVLSAFLQQYHSADGPGRFSVEGGNGRYHLIPSEVMDAHGKWQAAEPVLSTPIYLPDEERTVDDTLDEIVAQINASSPASVGWGFVPLNLFNQTRLRIAAHGMPARTVLRQILEELPQRITWRLNYEPMMRRYILSFLIRPAPSSP